MSIVYAVVAFVALFLVWVVVPTILKKRHIQKEEITSEE